MSVNNYRQELIRWPTGEQAVDVMDDFEAMRGFPDVIGAIDDSHIPIETPQTCPENYINREDSPPFFHRSPPLNGG